MCGLILLSFDPKQVSPIGLKKCEDGPRYLYVLWAKTTIKLL